MTKEFERALELANAMAGVINTVRIDRPNPNDVDAPTTISDVTLTIDTEKIQANLDLDPKFYEDAAMALGSVILQSLANKREALLTLPSISMQALVKEFKATKVPPVGTQMPLPPQGTGKVSNVPLVTEPYGNLPYEVLSPVWNLTAYLPHGYEHLEMLPGTVEVQTRYGVATDHRKDGRLRLLRGDNRDVGSVNYGGGKFVLNFAYLPAMGLGDKFLAAFEYKKADN